MRAAWVESLPVARFHGVGPVTARKMQALGIETGANLKAKPLVFLQTHLGSAAAWYYAIARGQDDRPVDPGRTRKSSGSETTLDRDLTKAAEIEAGVLRMADDVWSWCETAQSFGRTVTVKVKFPDFRLVTRSRSYPGVVAEHAQLRHASLDLIRLVFPVEKGIRLVGVTVSNFETPGHEDHGLPLFGCAVDSADMAPIPAGLS
jgi:DNA polymerase-4